LRGNEDAEGIGPQKAICYDNQKGGGAMPPLTDPEKKACFENALKNWRYEGYIVLTDVAYEWMMLNLETRLIYDDPNNADDPIIHVVNLHDA
jgi:hypothetical protein